MHVTGFRKAHCEYAATTANPQKFSSARDDIMFHLYLISFKMLAQLLYGILVGPTSFLFYPLGEDTI